MTQLGLGLSISKGTLPAEADQDVTDIVEKIVEVGGTIPPGFHSAINSLVKCLKVNISIWDRIHVLKGLVGGNAASHALNWKNVTEPDAAIGHHTTWQGALTEDLYHTYYGTQGTGLAGDYGDENIDAIDINGGTVGHSLFAATHSGSATSVGNNRTFLGVYESATSELSLSVNVAEEMEVVMYQDQLSGQLPNSNSTNTFGTHLGNRNIVEDQISLRNEGANTVNSPITGGVIGTVPVATKNIYSFALNNNNLGDINNYDGMISFMFIGEGFKAAELGFISSCIKNFLRTTGRYVHFDVWDYLTEGNFVDHLAIRLASEAREQMTLFTWNKVIVFNPILPQYGIGSLLNMKDPSLHSAIPVNTPQLDGGGYRFNGIDQYLDSGVAVDDMIGNISIGTYLRSKTPRSDTGRPIGSRTNTGSSTLFTFKFTVNTFAIQQSAGGGNQVTLNRLTDDDVIGMVSYRNDGDTDYGMRINQIEVAVGDIPKKTEGNPFNFFIGAYNSQGSPSNYWAGTMGGYFFAVDLELGELEQVENAMLHIQKGLGRDIETISTEAESYLESAGAALVNLPASEVYSKIKLINAEVTNGNWDYYEFFYIFGVSLQTDANLVHGLKHGSFWGGTVFNVPPIDLEGVSGNGSAYINTSIVASDNFSIITSHNGCYNVYVKQDISSLGYYFGWRSNSNQTFIGYDPTTMSYRMHQNALRIPAHTHTLETTLYSIVRDTIDELKFDYGGVNYISYSNHVPSDIIANREIYILGYNSNNTPSLFMPDGKVSHFSAGSASISRPQLTANIEQYLATAGGEGQPIFIPTAGVSDETLLYVVVGDITNPIEIAAADQLYHDLKGDSKSLAGNADIWVHAKAVYPMSPTSHAAGLLNFRDLANSLVDGVAVPTHGATGFTFDQSLTQYFNTGFDIISGIDSGEFCMSFYIRQDTSTENAQYIWGTAGPQQMYMRLRINTAQGLDTIIGSNGSRWVFSSIPVDIKGLITSTYSSVNSVRAVYRNRTQIDYITGNVSSVVGTTEPIYLGAHNLAGTASSAWGGEISSGYMGKSLNIAEQEQLYDAFQRYNTTLNRQVDDHRGELVRELEDYFTKHGISDNVTEMPAIRALYTELVLGNLWDDAIGIYPISPTEAGVSFTGAEAWGNLRNPIKPLNSLGDAKNPTQSVNGLVFAGAEVLDTTINGVDENLTYNNTMAFYSPTTVGAGTLVVMGASDGTNRLDWLHASSKYYYSSHDFGVAPNRPITDGFILGTSNANTNKIIYINGLVDTVSDGLESRTAVSLPMYLGAYNSSGAEANHWVGTISFGYISKYLTETKVWALRTAIRNYQLALDTGLGSTRHVKEYVNDAEIQAYILNGGYKDIDTLNGLDKFITTTKASLNTWAKVKFVYPLAGIDATQQAIELKAGVKNLTFYDTVGVPGEGGVHAQTGWRTVANNFADTGIIPSTDLNVNDVTMSLYVTDGVLGGVGIGSNDSVSEMFRLWPSQSGTVISDMYNESLGDGRTNPASSVTNGLIDVTYRAVDKRETYVNGISLGEDTIVGGGTPPSINSIYISASSGTPFSHHADEYRFVAFLEKLSTAEEGEWFAAVEQLQVDLKHYHPDIQDWIDRSGVTDPKSIMAASFAREAMTQAEWDGVRLFNILSPESEAVAQHDMKRSEEPIFSGTYSYGATGFNTLTAGYIDTNVFLSTLMANNKNVGLGFYFTQVPTGTGRYGIIGAQQTNSTNTCRWDYQISGSRYRFAYHGSSDLIHTTATYSLGMHMAYRDALDNQGLYRDGGIVQEATGVFNNKPSVINSLWVGAYNNEAAGTNFMQNGICGGYFVTEDLTKAQLFNVGDAMEIAQEYLGR